MTERQFALFMFVNLARQSEAWSWVVKGMVNQKVKQIHNDLLNSQKRFMQEFEKELCKWDENLIEQWAEHSQVFSDVLEMICKAETIEKKHELYYLMKEYMEGKIKFIDKPEAL